MSCLKITNTANDYSWGSEILIPKFFGVEPNGEPQAEIWLGSHSSNPSRYVDNGLPIDNDVSLSFLVKILAAAKPLSIQAHPNKIQAEEGFVKENILNIHHNAFNRNYKDDNHKPEMIIAIEDGFKALCGFKDVNEAVKTIEEISQHVEYSDDNNVLMEFKDVILQNGSLKIKKTVKELLETNFGVVVSIALNNGLKSMQGRDTASEEIRTLVEISSYFPNDVGIAIATMMNTVVLSKGEALFLPAGNIHAYVSGIGLEVMANSDNVLRGGLTTKYIDGEELVHILDGSIMENPILKPEVKSGVKVYKPISDFTVYDAKGKELNIELHNENAIAVALEKSTISINGDEMNLDKGESVLIREEEKLISSGHVVFTF